MKYESNFRKTVKKFFHRKLAVVGLVICLVMLFVAIMGPSLSSYSPSETVVEDRYQPPSSVHLFGADDLGRDMFARILDGARITVAVGVGSTCIALVAGTLLGLLAGFFGGVFDTVISCFMDALWAFPAIILALAINTVLGPSLLNIFIAIGVVYIPDFFRIVRSRTITIRELEYVIGARAIGQNSISILWHYVLPNMSSTLIVQTTLCCAKAVIAEASLSFLGLGVPLPMASWGSMLKSGYPLLERAPWLSLFPGICIMLLVLGLNFLGDGLRDALDVRIRDD